LVKILVKNIFMKPLAHKIDIALRKLFESKGLFYNINKRKKAGKSRPKSKSTVDPKTYDQMKNW
jgi:hypothetical protein